MEHARFQPDIVVGLSEGGHIVGSIFAANFGYRLVTLNVVWMETEGRMNVQIIDNIPEDLRGRKLLLIDSEVYTGLTIETALEVLRSNCVPTELKTASVFVMKESHFWPDFFFEIIPRKRFMPWVYSNVWKDSYKTSIPRGIVRRR